MTAEKDKIDSAHRSWRWLVLACLALVLIGPGTLVLNSLRSRTLHGLPIDPIEPAPDFTLLNQDRQFVSLSEYHGRVVLLFFGFTNCPDECPATMAVWRQVDSMLGADAEQVTYLFITVDPVRDTPEQLKAYLSIFSPTFVGLTGSSDDIEFVARSYAAFFANIPLAEDDYLVDHTTLTHLIDQDGNLIRAYPYGTLSDDIVADIRYLLDQ